MCISQEAVERQSILRCLEYGSLRRAWALWYRHTASVCSANRSIVVMLLVCEGSVQGVHTPGCACVGIAMSTLRLIFEVTW